jgi:hypothetical protein
MFLRLKLAFTSSMCFGTSVFAAAKYMDINNNETADSVDQRHVR